MIDKKNITTITLSRDVASEIRILREKLKKKTIEDTLLVLIKAYRDKQLNEKEVKMPEDEVVESDVEETTEDIEEEVEDEEETEDEDDE